MAKPKTSRLKSKPKASKLKVDKPDTTRIAQFLFEVGTMRKIMRVHSQALLTNDMSDNIATHSFRVAVIGFFLARMEGADWQKVMVMCLLHDMGEVRTNDHNWIHKRYVSEDGKQVLEEQLGSLPFSELAELAREYEERKTKEAIVAKDADVLDQVLLLREYAWQGNKEAEIWLGGKREQTAYNYLKYAVTESAKILGRALYDEEPSSWWKNIYTNKRLPNKE
jgi:putative hydrolase of HD superfamily